MRNRKAIAKAAYAHDVKRMRDALMVWHTMKDIEYALYRAVLSNSIQCASVCIDMGAKVSKKHLKTAVIRHNTEMLAYLLNHR